jgi:hypothetical protein
VKGLGDRVSLSAKYNGLAKMMLAESYTIFFYVKLEIGGNQPGSENNPN